MKKNLRLITVCMLALLMAQLAGAFGVTNLFYEGNPIITKPSAVEEFVLLLQNTDESRDVKVRANIIEGGDIAEIIDESNEYFVPMGMKNVKVNIRVNVPEAMKPGDIRNIKVGFSQFDVDQEGNMVQLRTGINTVTQIAIAAAVVEERGPKPLPGTGVLVAAGIFALVVIGAVALRRRRVQKRR